MNLDQIKATFLEQQRDAFAQFEVFLAEQRAEAERVMAELQQNFDAEAAALVEENQSLRQMLAERETQANDAVADPNLPSILQEIEALKLENAKLKESLEEKADQLDELKCEFETPRDGVDLESYEAELNRFRQQLEVDRQKLNAELRQIRDRNQELDEATREMEMEFSRERAELARERTKLERLREEVRAELERVQRDSPMRESLMSVNRLRGTITQANNR